MEKGKRAHRAQEEVIMQARHSRSRYKRSNKQAGPLLPGRDLCKRDAESALMCELLRRHNGNVRGVHQHVRDCDGEESDARHFRHVPPWLFQLFSKRCDVSPARESPEGADNGGAEASEICRAKRLVMQVVVPASAIFGLGKKDSVCAKEHDKDAAGHGKGSERFCGGAANGGREAIDGRDGRDRGKGNELNAERGRGIEVAGKGRLGASGGNEGGEILGEGESLGGESARDTAPEVDELPRKSKSVAEGHAEVSVYTTGVWRVHNELNEAEKACEGDDSAGKPAGKGSTGGVDVSKYNSGGSEDLCYCNFRGR